MSEQDDETYLKLGEPITPPSEESWAQIGEDGELVRINWDKIEEYAVAYDNGQRHQTFVICKLLSLVRKQVREGRDK